MSDKDPRSFSLPRRTVLGGLGAAMAVPLLPKLAFGQTAKLATAAINTTGLNVSDSVVKVGILHSVTGTMAISETGSVEAEKLAISQINARGGVLGRKIEFIQEDGASDWPTFAEKSKKLLTEDKVAAVFGCWTSASRKAVLPVFEQYKGILYYPTFYEGLEQSHDVFYEGQEATQQIIAGLDWVTQAPIAEQEGEWLVPEDKRGIGGTKGAKTFYLLGSDYIWPRTSNKIARKHIENHLKLEVVGEEYFPLGSTEFQSVINKIKLKKPDVIYAIIVGGSNVAFYKQLKAAGIDMVNKQKLLTISVTEDEIRGIGGDNIVGAYASMKYFQSQDNPVNKEFVKEFKTMWGADSVIGDVTQAAYEGPLLWALACEKAKSFDTDKVIAAQVGVELDAPEGKVKVHENHHLWSKTKIGRARTDGQYDVIWQTKEWVEPNPFPAGYQ
jgi:urea transport system substrate-binding protein